jgi:hypothetical protein
MRIVQIIANSVELIKEFKDSILDWESKVKSSRVHIRDPLLQYCSLGPQFI